MDNKLVMISIAAVIGIIVLGSVLMPILDDATETERTFTNEGFYTMTRITSDTDVVLAWDHTNPTVVSVGDKEIALNVPVGTTQYTILGSDELIVRYSVGTTNTTLAVNTSTGYMEASITAGTDMTMTISGYSLSVTNGTTTRTATITDGFYVDPDGVYVMKKPTDSAYLLKSEDIIILNGITYLGGATVNNAGVFGIGTINDGLDLEFVQVNTMQTTPTITFGDTTFNYTDVNDYNDLVQLSNCQFTISEGETTVTATYSYFLVPQNVTAERSVHFTAGQNAIFAAIPVMIILAVLLGVVALVIRSRMD